MLGYEEDQIFIEEENIELILSLALTLLNKFLDSLNLPASKKSGYKKSGVESKNIFNIR